MKRVHSALVLSGLALAIVLSVAIAPAADASQSASSLPLAIRTVHTHITLTLGSPAVQPGQKATFLAQVTPAVAGRIVYLRELHDGTYVNVASGQTNRLGQLTFRHVFSGQGSQRLRATVIGAETATKLELPATSYGVIEDVAVVLPVELGAGQTFVEGASSSLILLIQQRLTDLGYWLGTPNGNFGDATQQAVYALEKAANLPRTGVINQAFVTALNNHVLPTPKSTSGNAIDVNLATDLVMFVQNGQLRYVLNTSTGGGYTYTEDGETDVAITPTGVFSTQSVVNGLVTDSLGSLWRPRFFYEGFAIHGDSYVPAEPESHGCVRVSNEAIDWIWAQNLDPIGMKVWVYN